MNNDHNNASLSFKITYSVLNVINIDHYELLFSGADILIGKSIKVAPVPCEGEFMRRPTSHTCGCVLEIPDSYTSYVDFKSEFNAVLQANVWSMDIV